MANFDTAAKRFSGMGLAAWDPPLLPIPDGTVGTEDRPHFLDLYNGIALDSPTVITITEPEVSAFVVQAQSFFPRSSAIERSSFGFTLLEHLYQRLRGLVPAGGF